MTQTNALTFQNVTIRDAQNLFINNFSHQVQGGEIVSLMGPSGSGKSTLLAYVAGFLSKHFSATGDVQINAQGILNKPAEQRRVGLLFQDDLLLPHLNIGQNLAFGIRSTDKTGAKRSKADRRALVEQALESAGLVDFAERRPATLSGGQRARIALMRTLLSEPHALLLDEPFSKLDAGLRQHFRDFVREEVAARNLPTLMVTHDMEDAIAMKGAILQLGDAGTTTFA